MSSARYERRRFSMVPDDGFRTKNREDGEAIQIISDCQSLVKVNKKEVSLFVQVDYVNLMEKGKRDIEEVKVKGGKTCIVQI